MGELNGITNNMVNMHMQSIVFLYVSITNNLFKNNTMYNRTKNIRYLGIIVINICLLK